MQNYANNVQDITGNAVYGAIITVNIMGGGIATIYSDNSLTIKSNPIYSDVYGNFSFYAADGRYSLSISYYGNTVIIPDILFEDPIDISPIAATTITSGVTSLTGVTLPALPYYQTRTAKLETSGITTPAYGTSSTIESAEASAGGRIGAQGVASAISGYSGTGRLTGVVGNSSCTVGASPSIMEGVRGTVLTSGGTITNTYLFSGTQTYSGGTITNWTGLNIPDALGSPTNVYGANLQVSSGANRYNLYCGGTAQNYTAGEWGIGILPSASSQLTLAAGTTAKSPVRITHGVAPTTPVDGDMWTTSAGLFIRINGVTKTVTLI